MCKFIDEENLQGAFSYLDNITIAAHSQADPNRTVSQFMDAI